MVAENQRFIQIKAIPAQLLTRFFPQNKFDK
jgi:hypothetical protein